MRVTRLVVDARRRRDGEGTAARRTLARIEPLLPPRPPPSPKGRRPPVDDRDALRGILFVLKTGIPWQALPAEAFGVSGSSCWRRFGEWNRHRHLARAAPAPAQPPRQGRRRRPGAGGGRQRVRPRFKGGAHTGPNPTDRAKKGCKRHLLTDADGVPLVVRTTAANVTDETQLPALLESMPAVRGPRGRPRRKPGSVFGDRAYGTAATVALVVMLGIFSFLAPRSDDTHGQRPGLLPLRGGADAGLLQPVPAHRDVLRAQG
jgi:transposase